MAISVDWANKIINVPRADMTLIQASPVEIRELDLNQFRLILKGLEDNEEGMPFPDTHIHNTEVSLGGVSYARVIEMINGYTLTFEDGQYAVNLIGANSNVGDIVNVNQVSVRANNSAGLISSPDIEFSVYQKGIWLDRVGGTPGTAHPAGSQRQPVDNLADALIIANFRGVQVLRIIGDWDFLSGDDLDGFGVIGENQLESSITLAAGVSTDNTEFRSLSLSGVADGVVWISDCLVTGLTGFRGRIQDSTLSGNLVVSGTSTVEIHRCIDGTASFLGAPVLDLNSVAADIIAANYTGILTLKNVTQPVDIGVGLTAGYVLVDSTCTDGDIIISGIGSAVNSGTPNSFDDSGLLNLNLISRATWDALIENHTISGSAGEVLRAAAYNGEVFIDVVNGTAGTTFPKGTKWDPVNNLADGLTIATSAKLKTLRINGTVTLTQSFANQGWRIYGDDPAEDIINLNGQNVAGVNFEHVTLDGTQSGEVHAHNCTLDTLLGAQGIYIDCFVIGGITSAASGTRVSMVNCHSSGSTVSVLDAVGAGRVIGGVGLTGDWEVRNIVGGPPPGVVQTEFQSGQVTLAASCTGGSFFVAGSAEFTDNSLGTTVSTAGLLNPATIDTQLSATHGLGAWDGTGGGGSDWTSAEKEQIRYALGVDGVKAEAKEGQLQFMKMVQLSLL